MVEELMYDECSDSKRVSVAVEEYCGIPLAN